MIPWPSVTAAIGVLIAGFSILWIGTDGGAAWTTESARRLAVLESPLPLPAVRLRDENGRSVMLTGFDRSIILVDFIYTRCPTVCLAMGAEFKQLQSDLVVLGWQDEVQLLSLTFDPDNDTSPELMAYLSRFSALKNNWTAARFENDDDLAAMLVQLGVIVIPDPTVGFVHNAAIYLVHDGKVVGIYDFDDRSRLLGAIQRRLKTT